MNLFRQRVTLSFTWHILLAAFLVLFAMVGSLAYGGYRLYQKILSTETMQRQLVEEQNRVREIKEEAASKLIAAQAEELTQTKEELEKTKTAAAKTTAQIKTLTASLDAQAKASKDTVITSSDLSSYVTGVVQLLCVAPEGIVSGSGSLFKFKEVAHAVLTNYHVVKNADHCVVIMTNNSNAHTGIFALKPALYSYNTNTDEAILEIGDPLLSSSVPVDNYNYTFSDLKKCVSPVAVGTPVVIIGFPAYAKRDSTISVPTIGSVNAIYRTVTNGIISGYDTSTAGQPNYFVSAKIDNGNSGGMALAKDANGLCALGLPTWLSVGNYETQGLVQNIANVLPNQK